MITQDMFNTYTKLEFPFEYQFEDQNSSIVINKLQFVCCNCHNHIDNIRYTDIKEYGKCIQIDGCGKCPNCKNILQFKNRFYLDGRILVFNGSAWKHIKPVGFLKKLLIKTIKALIWMRTKLKQ